MAAGWEEAVGIASQPGVRKCANCGTALAGVGPASLARCAACGRPVCSYACRMTREDCIFRRQCGSDTGSSNSGGDREREDWAPSLFDLAFDRVEHPKGGTHGGGLGCGAGTPSLDRRKSIGPGGAGFRGVCSRGGLFARETASGSDVEPRSLASIARDRSAAGVTFSVSCHRMPGIPERPAGSASTAEGTPLAESVVLSVQTEDNDGVRAGRAWRRSRCQCRCGCARRPGRLIPCTKCQSLVGPGCCATEHVRGAPDTMCHPCATSRGRPTMAGGVSACAS